MKPPDGMGKRQSGNCKSRKEDEYRDSLYRRLDVKCIDMVCGVVRCYTCSFLVYTHVVLIVVQGCDSISFRS